MALIAQRMGNIRPSATVAVTTRANELKAAGRDVIGLGAGEPDFATPPHIVAAAEQAMRDGLTRYAPAAGIPALREAIADKLRRDNGLTYGIDQINVGCGGKNTIFSAVLSVIDPGDEAIVPAPFWVSYTDIVRMAEGVPVIVPCPAADAFKLTPARLEAAITPRTKLLFLNSPSNPSGRAYAGAELAALGAVLVRHPRIVIVTDDMYEKIVYDGFRFHTIAERVPALYDRTLTLNGLSKAYCMTGWRVGYAAGPAAIVRQMNTINSQSITSTSTISQHAAVAALTGPQDFIADNNATFRTRRDIAVEMLRQCPGLACDRPEGAFYLFPSCEGVIGKRTPDGKTIASDEDFVTWLLESEGVAAVHGAAFGLSPCFRISYAVATADLTEACTRIRRACEALTPNRA